MANIKEIILYNFKASYGETKIELDGKNLLMYGENGSGKSSVYWALYTLLQSSTKEIEETDKYFDFNHEENLINRDFLIELDKSRGFGNYSVDVGKNVQIEIKDEDDNIYNLSLGGLSSTTNKTALANLNRYCDFITHRLLINFYNFRNSQEIDLWKIFNREIFPFVYDKKDKGNKTIESLIKQLYENQPFEINSENEYSLLDQDDSIYEYYEKIKTVNTEISELVFKIENEANEFFSKYFDNSDNEYKLSLIYTNKFFFGNNIIDDRENDKINGVINPLKLLRTPKIILKIYKKAHNSFELITRPQTYLNEALITQLSLSIRLALTKSRAVNYPGQFLVLDDMLISLDMSNRDKVLDIILNEFAPKYKIYLFTHERSFFNIVKRRLVNRNLLEDWNIKEVFMNNFVTPSKPIIVDNKDYLSLALYHLKNFDLPAAANYLRKECEFRMKYLLPENLAKKETDENTKYNQLENLITNFFKYYSETLNQNITNLLILKEKKDLILNPLSHDNLDSEIYKDELLSFHNLLLEMRKIKKYIILKSDEEFYFNQIDHDGDLCRYNVKTIENIIFYKVLDGSLVCKNSLCEFTIQEKQGQKIQLNHPTKFMDLQKVAYNHALKTKGLHTYPDKLLEFTNIESKTFQELINEFDV